MSDEQEPAADTQWVHDLGAAARRLGSAFRWRDAQGWHEGTIQEIDHRHLRVRVRVRASE